MAGRASAWTCPADRAQEGRLVRLAHREHAVVLDRLVGRQRADRLGERREGRRRGRSRTAGRPPGVTASRARAGSGPGSSDLDPEQLREVGWPAPRTGAALVHRRSPRADAACPGVRPTRRLRALDGDHGRPAGDPAAPARARPDLRRPRDAARPVDEAEVRARARAALTELGGADPDRNVGLTDYLLGQADPIGRADASRHLREDPDDHAARGRAAQRGAAGDVPGRRAAPAAGRAPRRGRAATRRAPRRSRRAPAAARKSPLAGLSDSQTRLIAVVGGAAACSCSSSCSRSPASSAAATMHSAAATDDHDHRRGGRRGEIQRVAAAPPSAAATRSGEAVFGLATGDQPFVDVSIDGLDPAPNDQTYVVWLMLDRDRRAIRSRRSRSSENGSFQNRFAIPSAVLADRRPGALRRRLDRPGRRRSASSSATRSRTSALCSRSPARSSCGARSRRPRAAAAGSGGGE